MFLFRFMKAGKKDFERHLNHKNHEKSRNMKKNNNANSNLIKIVKKKEVSLYSNSRRFSGDICNLVLIKIFF